MELEDDDAFFADISNQISLLIMDDDEDPVKCCSSASLQAFSRVCYWPTPPSAPLLYEQACRRESKGTGVFIPRPSFRPRRKNRQRKGRFASFNRKSYKQVENLRVASNEASSEDPSCNYFNSKNY
ncbi:hypothetical protein HHK36_012599 [Tetracentron sinense]|uniref:Uncharacterized protein n=1 Tax=Tetracentron sinense TaxID=13715 RepID=A0A835DFM6_TETSI|nr:hypothetical protein HHK36_012599 [Tetracentron sinense]